MVRYLKIFVIVSMLLAGCLGCSNSQKNVMQTVDLKSIAAEETAEEKASDAIEIKVEQISDDNISAIEEPIEESEIFVYVCGAVQNAGVYSFPESTRVYEAIMQAGGYAEGAAEEYLNQAEIVYDGQRVYVPTAKEVEEEKIAFVAEENAKAISHTAVNENASNLININTATAEQLMTLSGVGESKAKSIISYREINGVFIEIEDIMKVEGIKEGMFAKIKNAITVR